MRIFHLGLVAAGFVAGSAFFYLRQPHRITEDEFVRHYGMFTIPHEGASFVQTYKSPEIVDGPTARLYKGVRYRYTVGLALAGKNSFSGMHKLATDEIWNFVAGDPHESLLLYPDGRGKIIVMGPDVLHGQKQIFVAPKGTWMGGRVVAEDYGYSVMANTLTPGFEYADYTPGYRDDLQGKWPQFSEQIALRTRGDSLAADRVLQHAGSAVVRTELVGPNAARSNKKISLTHLVIRPGEITDAIAPTSTQDRMILVFSGSARLTVNQTKSLVNAGGLLNIPAGAKATLEGLGGSELSVYLASAIVPPISPR